MGSSDADKSPKEANEPKTPVPQEQASVAPSAVAADWTGFQGYSPMPPHGFLAPSAQPHPYMWGVQPFIPPYGTSPHPYVAMYPHGSIYAHPTMAPGSYPFSPFAMPSPNGIAESPANDQGNPETDGKSSEVKEKLPVKRSKDSLGSLNMITGKNNEANKASGASANGGHSKSAESASEGSTDGSDPNSQNDSQAKSGSRGNSAEPSQYGSATHGYQNGGPNPPHSVINQTTSAVAMPTAGAVTGVPGPTTNLNIGRDYWAAAPSTAVPAMQGKVAAAPVTGGMVASGSRDSAQSQLWIQDERELKRQRRKQSNRESARRSRLRKQAECDELAKRAEVLIEENASLRAEVARIRSEYDQILAQNTSLKERLGELSCQEDRRRSRDDQRSGNNVQYSGQADHMQSGQ